MNDEEYLKQVLSGKKPTEDSAPKPVQSGGAVNDEEYLLRVLGGTKEQPKPIEQKKGPGFISRALDTVANIGPTIFDAVTKFDPIKALEDVGTRTLDAARAQHSSVRAASRALIAPPKKAANEWSDPRDTGLQTKAGVVGGAVTTTTPFMGGVGEALDMRPMANEAYRLWQDGDLDGLTRLASGNFIDLQGSSDTGLRRAVSAITATEGGPIKAVSEIAKAVPFFGPMAEQVELLLKDGKYAKAAGLSLGIIAPFGVHAIKGKYAYRPEKMAQAALDAHRIYAWDAKSLKAEEARIAKMPDGPEKVKEVERLDGIRQGKMVRAAREAAQKLLDKEIEAAANQRAKNARKKKPPEKKPVEAKTATTEKKAAKPKKAKAKDEPVKKTPEEPTEGTTTPALVTDAEAVKIKALRDQGMDPGQISFKLDIHEAEVRKVLGEESGTKPGGEIDRSKIERTGEETTGGESQKVVTPEEVSAIESHFGPDWDEIPTEQLDAWVEELRAGKADTSPFKEAVAETADEAIDTEALKAEADAELGGDTAQFHGAFEKTIGKIGEFDAEAALAEAEARLRKLAGKEKAPKETAPEKLVDDTIEQMDEIDIDTGSKDPVTEPVSDTVSPFRTEKDVTASQANNYGRSRLVASSIEELVSQTESRSSLVTTHKLVNDINRVLDGDRTVDIAQTREFLSELAARADEFQWEFMDESGTVDAKAFNEWRQFTQDSAKWARNAGMPDGVLFDGNQLNLFVDPTKLPEVIKRIFDENIEKPGKASSISADKLWRDTGLFFNPYDKKWRFELDDSNFKFKTDFNSLQKSGLLGPDVTYRLGDVIDHPTLFEIYPELADISLTKREAFMDFMQTTQGWFDDSAKTINITPYAKDVKGTILHETQHWIQRKEGFAQGGSLKTALDYANETNLKVLAEKAKDGLKKSLAWYDYLLENNSKRVQLLRIVQQSPELQIKLKRYKELDARLSNEWRNHSDTGGDPRGFFVRDDIKLLDAEKNTLRDSIIKDTKLPTNDALELLSIYGPNTPISGQIAKLEKSLISHSESKTRTTDDLRYIDSLSGEPLRDALKQVGDTNFEAYKSLAGEIEARDVSARQDLTPAQRRATLPLSSEVFKSDQVIVRFDSPSAPSVKSSGTSLYSGVPIDEIVKRLGKVHPATYPRVIQSAIADIANNLGVTEVLDIFGGVGKIGKIKDYGFKGVVRSNELEPTWGGKSTIELNQKNGVDYVTIGDSRKLPYADGSIPAIATSPTYGNLMALKSPSKLDSYQSLAGGKLNEGNTGGMVWSPEYEALHRQIYDEAYRVTKPGGFFILNMKDKPVSAAAEKNNWVPKKGSTVEVRNQQMKATEWHIKALEDSGFEFIDSIKVKEANPASLSHRGTRRFTVGSEDIVVLGKPDKTMNIPNVKPLGAKTGHTFYSGVDPVAAYKAAMKYMDDARGVKDFKPREAFKMAKESFVRKIVDTSGNLREEFINVLGQDGYRMIQAMYLSKGAGARASRMYRQMEKEVFGGLNSAEQKALDLFILADRLVAISKTERGKTFKYPKGMPLKRALSVVENFEAASGLNPNRALAIRQRAQGYADWMRKPVKDLFENEIIGEKEYNDLLISNYRRIQLAEIFDKENPTLKGHKRSVYDSGIDTLQKGKKSDLYEPSSRVVALEVFNRAYGRVANNLANLELLRLAKDNPTNPFVRVKERTVEEVGELEPTRRKTLDSIMIKRDRAGLSDYEFRTALKEKTGKSSLSRLSNEELSKFETELGDGHFKYNVTKVPDTQKIPKGWGTIFVYEGGVRKSMRVSPELMKEWITSSPEISYKFAQVLRYASGSSVLRTFATGINWSFAVKNIPRDIMHIWFSARQMTGGKWTSTYSTMMPKFAAQMGADLTGVFKDAVTRGPKWQKFIDEGGGMEWLTHQGRIFQKGRHIEGWADKAYDFLGYFGETSEIWTRLALRDRVIKNRAKELGISYEEAAKDPKISREATFVARDYMDFSQGGSFTKAADAGLPYLNATVQGTRGLLRSFKKDTALQSTMKLAQLGALVTGIYIARRAMAPEAHQQLRGNIDDVNNLIIPLPESLAYTDEHGQKVYQYLKIPMDSGQKFFKAVFEGAVDQWYGEEVDYNKIKNAFEALSPVGLSSLPPTVNSAIAYLANKDLWSNRDVWRGEGGALPYPESGDEYIPGRTPQIAIDLGQVTGLSPERGLAALHKLIPKNIWGTLLGAGYEWLADVPESQRQRAMSEALSHVPEWHSIIGVTNPYSQWAEQISKERDKDRANRLRQNNEIDTMLRGYLFDKNVGKDEIIDAISKYDDRKTFERLKDRVKFAEATYDLPNYSFWMSMRGLPVEVRAKVYADRVAGSTPEQLQVLDNEIGLVRRVEKRLKSSQFSIFTDEFKKELRKLGY